MKNIAKAIKNAVVNIRIVIKVVKYFFHILNQLS